ncbi:tetratricopeptide repeat protein [Blattabacterium cuenoti]|uniref:tetratricopeptide repeat protein n=1 Tax=Blattabacterium cuenoti TaxID=1653831 RepID=UPI00163BE660|nr:hypothetical protein [Blattabacterium cuenoti]
MVKSNKKYVIIYSCIITVIALVFGILYYEKFFIHSHEKKALLELTYAQKYLSQGEINNALNKKKTKINYLGFLGIISKYPFTKAGNISKFYAGICYYKLGNYKESIKMMESFSAKDDILFSIKYGFIGDAFSQMRYKEKALIYYIKAAKVKENELTTPLYYYKAALLNFYMKRYKKSKYLLEKIEIYYPSFLYKKNVEKYIMFINNKL